MLCRQIIQALEAIAPRKLAESWDNVGLLVGREEQEVHRILIALDATEDVIDQAIANHVDLIITHHPVLFSKINRINNQDATGRKLLKLIQNNIACYALHTNFDVEVMADEAAKKLGLANTRVLAPIYSQMLYKIVVYVPIDSIEKVRVALTKEGAGHIGNYSECTFGVQGVGTYRPLEGTNPYIGEQDKLTHTKEVRIETIVREEKLQATIKSMLHAHPYEEVAYDIYKLENQDEAKGIGAVGYLSEEKTLRTLAEQVKIAFGLDHVRTIGDLEHKVSSVAICPGSGKSMIKDVLRAKANVYITGDMDHHTVLDALEDGLMIIDAGHFGTEHFFVDYMREQLQKFLYEGDTNYVGLADDIRILTAKEENPFTVI